MGKQADVAADEIEYPSSDGKPTAESDLHRNVMFDLIERLKARSADRADVYVSGNLLVYYDEGNPRVSLAPDCFVAFGIPPGDRRVFKTWEEGVFPTVVFEITSKTTEREDLTDKFDIYQDVWKVSELFMFDPTEEYLEPSLLGYRMSRGVLKPLKSAGGRLTSAKLGITLERDGTRLVLRDAATGGLVFTQPEAEVARLKAEIDALRKRRG